MSSEDAQDAAQLDALAREIAAALEEVVDTTGCVSSYRLWAEATEAARKRVFGERVMVNFPLDACVPEMRKASRSKYRALAAWRHAVLWRKGLDHVEDVREKRAIKGIWFSRVEHDEPPFSWSQETSGSPLVHHFSGSNEMRRLSKQACWATIKFLRAEPDALLALKDTGRSAILIDGVLRMESLSDVLGIDELWTKEKGKKR